EADHLGNERSARTRRIMRYVQDHRPVGVCMSGTITSKSIKDYYHLIKWCLGDYSPLPLSEHIASEWAALIDSGAQGGASGPILPLVHWAQRTFPQEKI